jgi:hypothetical protein
MSKPILPPVPSTPIRISIPSDARVPSLPLNVQSPLPVRSNPNVNPYNAAPYRRAPVGSTFAGMAEGGVSVADMVRAQKDGYLTSDGFQIAGPNYTQQIRKDAAGERYIAPPSMPTAGYAAAFYPYPSSKMKVGAALAGTPVRGGTTPAWVKQSKYYIPESPAQHRKAQMATLMGLGGLAETKAAFAAIWNSPAVAQTIAICRMASGSANTPWGDAETDEEGVIGAANTRYQSENSQNKRRVKLLRVIKAYKAATGEYPDAAAMLYFGQSRSITVDTLKGEIAAYEAARLRGEAFPFPETAVDRAQCAVSDWLNENAEQLLPPACRGGKAGTKACVDALTASAGGGSGGSGGGTLLPGLVTIGPVTLDQPEADESNPWIWPIVGVVGVVALVWALNARNR